MADDKKATGNNARGKPPKAVGKVKFPGAMGYVDALHIGVEDIDASDLWLQCPPVERVIDLSETIRREANDIPSCYGAKNLTKSLGHTFNEDGRIHI